ncbi:endonuclease MutS2 [Thermovibrio ammonificans]|uniref:Endonuclease MutS2 n=1 Tax=Thermovibrio ammonificans (strain DSM 15698 / JCM 12110 / HB-1) TaxID=648996 RepID=E8T5M2_THEA1|nr:endonuclease MutS2 [Thermovibrio ammonificans]ADU96497.1 MutS2 family protein [Thermovibrio ammonificans HB-1]
MSVLELLEFDKLLERAAAYAKSEEGRKRVLELKPSTRSEEVKENLSQTELFCKLMGEKSLPVEFFPNLSETLRRLRIEGAVLSQEELHSLLKALNLASRLSRFFGSLEGERFRPFESYARRLSVPAELLKRFNKVFDDYGAVQDSASPTLRSVRRSIRSVSAKIREKLHSIVNRHDDVCPDRVVTERDGRYVILAKPAFKSRFHGVVHDRSSSGQTLYVEPMAVVELNNRLRELRSLEEKEVKRILAELSDLAREHYESVARAYNALVEVDFRQALASLSLALNGTLPEFGSSFKLKDARHPLLALSGKEVVPVDILLERGLVITGPNTGGKTVALKTLGLISMMAQSGFLVPAGEGSTLRFVRKWFADLGDEQSIEQSLSTFSGHIKRVAQILKEADEHSLVLLDELGSGTDPVEGSALAVAILNYLKEKRALTVVTTHFSPVKLFAYKDDYFQVASVLFDEESLKPLYKLIYGVIGKSYALVVAERFGVPKEVIRSALSLLGAEEQMAQELISALEKEFKRLQSQREEVERLKEELNRQRRLLREREEKLRKEFEERLNASIAELQSQLEKSLKEKNASKAREDFKKLVVSIKNRNALEPELAPSREPKPGDTVKVEPGGRKGKVVSVDAGRKRAKVQIGAVTVEVKLGQLRVVEEEVKRERPEVVVNAPKPSRFFPELKLLGMRGEEALRAVEKFLDEANLVGVKRVRIVHGYGEGILKRLVRDYLANSPYVKSFRPGKPEEGGDGATVVELY